VRHALLQCSIGLPCGGQIAYMLGMAAVALRKELPCDRCVVRHNNRQTPIINHRPGHLPGGNQECVMKAFVIALMQAARPSRKAARR
jgi:hypothetical protein